VLAVNGSEKDPAWDLVPGEIVETYKPHRLSARGANRRQRAEAGYYAPCSYCRRYAHEIGHDGCDDPRCSDPPSEAQVAAARARRDEAIALIAAEREHIAATIETESDELPELLTPEEAVARFLGLEAIGHHDQEPPTEFVEPAEPVTEGVSHTAAAAKQALVGAALSTGRFAGAYCQHPVDNLVDTLSIGQMRAALAQLGRGDGGELISGTNGSVKFCAAYSSSALAVNSFGAWLGREAELTLAGQIGFNRVEFEVKLPTGLPGKPPNLDVVAFSTDRLVAVESKCTEHLGEHEAHFQDSYDAAVEDLAHSSWQALYGELKSSPGLLRRLGVGQLVRHYLGLRRALADGLAPSATLLYVFWEPRDGDQTQAIPAHRAAVAELAGRVCDPAVDFIGLSYDQLWRDWSANGERWVVDHVAALRDRYDVDVEKLVARSEGAVADRDEGTLTTG